MNSELLREDSTLNRLRIPALVVGILFLAAAVVGAMGNPQQFFRSYLIGFVFIAMLSLGSLGVLMIHYMTGGIWGILLRRPLESAARVVPFVGLAFIPIAFGIRYLYAWGNPEEVAHNHLLHAKSGYLNPSFFIGRSVVFFIFWTVAAMLLARWGTQQERDGYSIARATKIARLSGPGIVLMALTLTFAAVDWLMSLTPEWYSTMYGISFMVGSALTGFTFCVIVAISMRTQPSIAALTTGKNYRDMGNLIFAFTMLWAYCTFSEFLLIWYANIKEEVPWHLTRSQGGWGTVSIIIIIFHFFLPFFMLLMRAIKDRPSTLVGVAFLVLFMRAVYVFWLVRPTYDAAFGISWMDVASLLGLLGIWLFLFVTQLRRLPVLPFHESYVREALTHG